MKYARMTPVVVALLLITGSPALAGLKSPGEKPAAKRDVRRTQFSDRQQAERFVDALNYVLGCRKQGPGLEVTLLDDGAVEIEGPPGLMRHVVALVGWGEESQPERSTRADRPGRDRRPRCDERPARRETRERDRGPHLEVRVFDLTHAHAKSLVKLVDMLRVGSPDPWVADRDDRTNTIIVKGTPEMVAAAESLIDQLDRPAAVAESEAVTRLVPLTHAEARNLAEVVSRVSHRTFREVEVVPDLWTNTLVLAGPKGQVGQAASLIKSLDVSPDAAKTAKKPKPDAGKRDKKPKPDADKAKAKKKPKAKATPGQAGKPKPKPEAKPPKGKKTPAEASEEKGDKPGPKEKKATPAARRQPRQEKEQKKEREKPERDTPEVPVTDV